MRIGIDVGGTNTDSVLINNNKIESSFKTNTSEDISCLLYSSDAADE